jgi:hypothetical protein
MAELNAIVEHEEVLADHDLDRRWLATLADAAGIGARFRIGHIADLLDRSQPDAVRVQQALAAADLRVPVRHRAGPDALWLSTFAAQITSAEPPLFDWPQGAALYATTTDIRPELRLPTNAAADMLHMR